MTTDQMLNEMASVLRMGALWRARAQGCDKWGNGPSAQEAMRHALIARDGLFQDMGALNAAGAAVPLKYERAAPNHPIDEELF